MLPGLYFYLQKQTVPNKADRGAEINDIRAYTVPIVHVEAAQSLRTKNV